MRGQSTVLQGHNKDFDSSLRILQRETSNVVRAYYVSMGFLKTVYAVGWKYYRSPADKPFYGVGGALLAKKEVLLRVICHGLHVS